MNPNIEIDEKRKSVRIKVNPKIYNKDVVLNAGYVFLDKYYVLIDGDPETEIRVEIIPKDGSDPEKAGLEFYNELLNYAEYFRQSEKNKDLRDLIVHRALYTVKNIGEVPKEDLEDKNDGSNTES